MTIPEIVRLLQNRIATLNGLLATAHIRGDIVEVMKIEADITETQATINTLINIE